MPKTDYLNDPDAPRPNSLVVGVTAFVQDDDGRVLMIERADNGLWALPGGGQDVGETTPAAAELDIHPRMRVRIDHGLACRSEPYLG